MTEEDPESKPIVVPTSWKVTPDGMRYTGKYEISMRVLGGSTKLAGAMRDLRKFDPNVIKVAAEVRTKVKDIINDRISEAWDNEAEDPGSHLASLILDFSNNAFLAKVPRYRFNLDEFIMEDYKMVQRPPKRRSNFCFIKGSMRNCRLQRMRLSYLSFEETDLSNSTFVDCELIDTDFYGADLSGCIFEQCVFRVHPKQLVRKVEWRLKNTLKEGESLMDTTFGSLSGKDTMPPVGRDSIGSFPLSPNLDVIAVLFCEVKSLKGCLFDRSVFDLNPAWFLSMGVIEPKKIEPPKMTESQTSAALGRVESDDLYSESFWEC